MRSTRRPRSRAPSSASSPCARRAREETESFRALVRGAFGTRRKTLRNAWARLAPADVIARAAAEAGVSLDARGETLSVEDFARMAAALDAAKVRQRSP